MKLDFGDFTWLLGVLFGIITDTKKLDGSLATLPTGFVVSWGHRDLTHEEEHARGLIERRIDDFNSNFVPAPAFSDTDGCLALLEQLFPKDN